MERSATVRSADSAGLLADASPLDPHLAGPGAGADVDVDVDVPGGQEDSDSVVVHVQLRPRRPAVRKCLAALGALAAEHPTVAVELTGLSKDDRIVRVTVGVDLGPRSEVAKFSASAQAAYLFVDGLFTALYDYMPVYVAEPSSAERAGAAGVLEAVCMPQPVIPVPRSSSPATLPAAGPAVTARRAAPVPA